MAIKYDYNSGCFVFKRFLLSGKTDGTRSWCSILPLSKATKSCFLASLNLYLLNKVDALLASGYDPKLGDGVGKNIAPLQKASLLSYEVLNSGQLKKYLNADW